MAKPKDVKKAAATKPAPVEEKKTKKVIDPEKKKARMEALKNRPEGQRCNSKQIDVIQQGDKTITTYGYPITGKGRSHVGVLTTTLVTDSKGSLLSVASAFVPGDLTVKAKKGHGTITGSKSKKDKDSSED